MAEQNDKLDFSQPSNELTNIANAQRQKLFPKNDYSPVDDKYSVTHPNALADGDEDGRGTGNYLDINNLKAGTIVDVTKRKDLIKGNKYKYNKPYQVNDNPDAESNIPLTTG